MKRTGMFIFAMILLFTVSCASSDSDIEAFDEDFNGKVSSKTNLDGYDFSIKYYEYYSLGENSILGYKENSSLYDAALKRKNDIENNMNCTITFLNGTSANPESSFQAAVMSGVRTYDAIMTGSYSLRPYIESKLFEPLSQVSDIINYTDSEKWGTWKMLEQDVWEGELYGLVPVQWPEFGISSGFMFVFNEKFANLLGQPDPREFIENDEWTRNKFGEMMTTYTTKDLGYDLYGGIFYEGHFYDLALRANNAQVYKYKDGKYVSGYHTEEGQEALEWADNFLHKDYKDCIYPNFNDDQQNYNAFIEEKTAMLLAYTAYIYGSRATLSYEVENYCVLPMPNGPEREKENATYSGFMEGTKNTLLFPLNGDIEKSALITNELFNYLDGYGKEETKEYYLRYVFHDERDYNVFMEVAANNRNSFVSDGMRNKVVEALYGSSHQTVTEVLTSTEEAQNELIEKYIVPTVTYLEEIFGEEALKN